VPRHSFVIKKLAMKSQKKQLKTQFLLLISALFSILTISCNRANDAYDLSQCKVYILGTCHSNHLFSELNYSLNDINGLIGDLKPDLICFEMTPEALNTETEGYFPTENTHIIETAKQKHIKYVPVDWRSPLCEQNKPAVLTESQQKFLRTAQQKTEGLVFNFLMQNNWKGYYDFVQKDTGFHQSIKAQHDIKIDFLGEEQDGYWLTRNKKITDKLIKTIMKEKPKVVLVTFGLHHKYILEENLKNYYGINAFPVPLQKARPGQPVNENVMERWEKNKANLERIMQNENTDAALKQKIKSSRRIQELDKFIKAEGVPNISLKKLMGGK